VFKLNKPTKTKSGETVVPFLVNGNDISVFDRNKRVKVLSLDDFDFKKNKSSKRIDSSKVVVVKGSSSKQTEESLFNPNESGGLGGIYEETATVTAEPTVVTKPEETAPIIEVEASTDEEIVFITGGADVDFKPIQTIILSDTFDFTSYGRIRVKPASDVFGENFIAIYECNGKVNININSSYTHEVIEETSTSGSYSYDDLYGDL